MLLSVSVDLDQIDQYREIHGLSRRDPSNLVYSRAVPRLVDWARQRRIPLTWFVVGRDAERPENAEALAKLAAAGDEMACHSYSHPYDLTRHPAAAMRAEIELGVSAIERASRSKVAGFRAPGYVVSDTLLDLVRECGLAYDSSVFPCPSYYALKLAKVTAIAAAGGRSSSVIDGPDVLRAPRTPYRAGRPYWLRGTGVWELPIQVTRRLRLPFIGTALALAGRKGARLLAQGVLGQPLVTLELHGIDALDETDGLTELAHVQRELRIPWHEKLEAIAAAVGVLTDKSYRCVTMLEILDSAKQTP